jgi:hypothetical protein
VSLPSPQTHFGEFTASGVEQRGERGAFIAQASLERAVVEV